MKHLAFSVAEYRERMDNVQKEMARRGLDGLLVQNLATQAESEFRAAISSDHNNAEAHAQLAILLEKRGDLANARTEAQASVRLQPNVDGLLVLARLDLKQSQLESAASEVERALALQPADATALALKRDIAAKQTVSK